MIFQSCDLGDKGLLYATRIATPEKGRIRVTCWKSGQQTYDIQLIYTVAYDYDRLRIQHHGKLMRDTLSSGCGYGEYDEDEPYSPFGCELFRTGDIAVPILLQDHHADILLYITENHARETGRILDVEDFSPLLPDMLQRESDLLRRHRLYRRGMLRPRRFHASWYGVMYHYPSLVGRSRRIRFFKDCGFPVEMRMVI